MKIKKENDIFTYFKMIQKSESKSILDAGMFLKRVGSISRQIMGERIPEEVRLDGIDFFPEVSFAVWSKIYDKVYSWQDFLNEHKEKHWELGIVLGVDAWRERLDSVELLQRMRYCCDYILLDSSISGEIKEIGIRIDQMKNIKVEGDVYYFIDNRG